MTVEEVKKLAKEQYGRDITDEQARAVLEKAQASANGELSDDSLEAVSGGFNWKAAFEAMAVIGVGELYKKL